MLAIKHLNIKNEILYRDCPMQPMETNNPLQNNWTLWGHLPHNPDWKMTGYIRIATFSTIEETIAVTECLTPAFVENCMLFLMKNDIEPRWEDKQNADGGYFSFVVPGKNVYKSWKEFVYRLVGETLTKNAAFSKCITGITISPKKNFSIVKIWTTTCGYKNPSLIEPVYGIQIHTGIFKKHNN